MSISGNIGEIRARIAAAAEKAGRSPDEIMLVAADDWGMASNVVTYLYQP